MWAHNPSKDSSRHVAALVAKPGRMGYLGVKTAVDYLQNWPVEKVVRYGCNW
jgi:hypothetical protein